MKAILEFTLPDEESEYTEAVQGGRAVGALFDIGQQVFRPARKHGYSSETIQKLLDRCNSVGGEADYPGDELVHELEQLFYRIIQEHNVELD